MPLDLPFLLVGWTTVLVIALGKGAFGGGLATVGVPLMSLVMEPVEAAILIAPLVVLMDVLALGAFGPATWSKPDLAWLLPGLALGIGIGVAVVASVDGALVGLLIAVVTLGFTAHHFLKRPATVGARPVSRLLGVLAGTASGFTTFVAHAGGPPVALYLLRRGLSKGMFAGTNVAFFTAGNMLKLPPYVVLGWDKPRLWLAVLALAPAVPLGVWLGKRLHDRLDQKTLFSWCYAVLGLAATKLLVDSARALS